MRLKSRRVYVGNLPPAVDVKDIENIFYPFGNVLSVDLKTPRGPCFAFVDFEDPRDAQDAVFKLNDYNYDGHRLRVEYPRIDHSRDGEREQRANLQRSMFRVRITGLPLTGSWQDLKDHMREAGSVCFATVTGDGSGMVEYVKYADMKYAVRKLNDSKFRSHKGDSSYIRVRDVNQCSSREGDRRDRKRSRSRSYSPLPRRSRRSSSVSSEYSSNRAVQNDNQSSSECGDRPGRYRSRSRGYSPPRRSRRSPSVLSDEYTPNRTTVEDDNQSSSGGDRRDRKRSRSLRRSRSYSPPRRSRRSPSVSPASSEYSPQYCKEFGWT